MNTDLVDRALRDAALDRSAATGLQSLRAAVARSPIMVRLPAPAAPMTFADWETVRRSPDVDAVILSWIASHVPGAVRRSRMH